MQAHPTTPQEGWARGTGSGLARVTSGRQQRNNESLCQNALRGSSEVERGIDASMAAVLCCAYTA